MSTPSHAKPKGGVTSRDPSVGSGSSAILRQRRIVSAYQTLPTNLVSRQQRIAGLAPRQPLLAHQRDAYGTCYCIQCAVSMGSSKRQGLGWQGLPSPYLEDLTKRLVKSPPARRKLQLVPQVRVKANVVSPYETLYYDKSGRAFRAQVLLLSPPFPWHS